MHHPTSPEVANPVNRGIELERPCHAMPNRGRHSRALEIEDPNQIEQLMSSPQH